MKLHHIFLIVVQIKRSNLQKKKQKQKKTSEISILCVRHAERWEPQHVVAWIIHALYVILWNGIQDCFDLKPKFILIVYPTSCMSKSPTNKISDLLDGRHIRGICWPWKKRNLLCTKEGLCSLWHTCTGIILLKYSIRNASKDKMDLWVHNFLYVAIFVEVARNAH